MTESLTAVSTTIEQIQRWMELTSTSETIRTRTYWIRRFLTWTAERGTTPWNLETADISQWLLTCGTAPNTRRSALSSARTVYRWGLSTGMTTADPTRQLPPIRVPRAVPRPAPSDAIERALHRATSRRDVLMLLLANYAGLRCGEIARLHTNDFYDGVLWVEGKGGHTRIVPVHSLLAELLELFPRGPFFPSALNPTGCYRPASISRRIRTLMDPGWSAHTIRHRFATEFFRRTPDLLALKELLGHASVSTTQIYAATDTARRARGVMQLPDLPQAHQVAHELAAVE